MLHQLWVPNQTTKQRISNSNLDTVEPAAHLSQQICCTATRIAVTMLGIIAGSPASAMTRAAVGPLAATTDTWQSCGEVFADLTPARPVRRREEMLSSLVRRSDSGGFGMDNCAWSERVHVE